MTDERQRKMREVFMRVAELPHAERAAELARLCGSDNALRADVEALLVADDNAAAAGFMSAPTRSVAAGAAGGTGSARFSGSTGSAALSSPLTERPGTRIGRFKLLQQIGEGGFGVVFIAEQDQPVRRRVALKIIKLGMDTRQVVARFEQERQALALMDHPNIAKVLDAGATEAGRPYFVMEYVTGDRITAFADAHRLSVRDRLDLFSQVCYAIQHAHQKGIIHRDLKPSNVLVSMVDGKPFAKVIDFGIAKATGARLTDKTLFTEHRQLIGTPEYMSPEQAEGSADIDTRTDVYALGVLLYELLTGATPFDAERLRSAAFGEMQRIIKEEEPPAPSLRISRNLSTLAAAAAARNSEPGRLGTLVKGELDWIVMKALEKDRARRYDGPNALAADVQRHLSGEPVVAAPPGVAYRVRKFVRKHRGPVLAGSAMVVALTAGVIGTTWQWYEAKKANEELSYQASIARSALSELPAALGVGGQDWSGIGAALEQEIVNRGGDAVPEGRRDIAMLKATAISQATEMRKSRDDLDAANSELRKQVIAAERAARERDVYIHTYRDFYNKIVEVTATEDARQLQAIVMHMRGQAEVRQLGGDWRSLEVNSLIEEGEEIRTGPKAMLTLRMGRSATLIVDEEARVAIPILMEARGKRITRIVFFEGNRLDYKVDKLGAADDFSVRDGGLDPSRSLRTTNNIATRSTEVVRMP